LRFDIEAETTLRLMSDVLSQGAKQFHGSLEDQLIQPGDTRTISYRLHVFDAARALETRIGIRAEQPVAFTIRNLSLVVQ
jgi:hypothetical protein